MSRFVVSLFLCVAILGITGCGGQDQQAEKAAAESQPTGDLFAGLSGNIDIAGGTAHIPVMKKSAQAIMTAHPEITITVAGGGSGVGARKVGEGLVNIGNTGRPLSQEEVDQYGLVSYPFAVDGVCAVVHPENPVQELSKEQLQAVYVGQIKDWKELGGAEGAIHLFTRDEASGTRSVFWKKALAKGEIDARANVVASNGAMKTVVAQDKNALGYVSLGHLDASLKAPRLDGVEVTQDNAASGAYPVVRRLYMNTKGDPDPLTTAFIAFVRGPQGAQFISESGYLPLPSESEKH